MMFRWKKRADSNCPRCNTPDENSVHVLRCDHQEARSLWNRNMSALQPWLIANHTSPPMAKAICDKLNNWQQGLAASNVDPSLSDAIKKVLTAQDHFGWEFFIYGFWSIEWMGIQQLYLTSLQSKVTPRRWAAAIIRKLWAIAWDMWDHRNRMLHDKDQGLLVQTLHHDMTSLYHTGYRNLRSDIIPLFRRPLKELLALPLAAKQLWVGRVKSATRRAARSSRTRSAYSGERSRMRTWLHSLSSHR